MSCYSCPVRVLYFVHTRYGIYVSDGAVSDWKKKRENDPPPDRNSFLLSPSAPIHPDTTTDSVPEKKMTDETGKKTKESKRDKI